jgi:hypothetical protein
MKSLQYYIDHMNQLLSELIQIATQLRDMSFQVISEEDLAPLQKRQEELLTQLEDIDQQLQKNYRHQLSTAMEEQIHNQLQTFQQLNQEFIQNLSTSHGLIQFELHRFENQEGEDFSRFSRLKKISPSPKSSETIESEENKEG